MTCSSCGNPKDQSEKYDLGDTTKPVTDVVKLAEANAGANWSCSWCRFDNRAGRSTCQQCGSSRERLQETPDLPEPGGLNPPAGTPLTLAPEPARKVISEGDYRNPPVFEDPALEIPPPTARPRGGNPVYSPERNKSALFMLLAVLALGSSIALAVWVFMPHEHAATVSTVHWQYTRELQQRYTRDGEGWGHPVDAFNVSCETRQRGTESCHPHDCNPHPRSYDCHPHDCRCHPHCTSQGNGYSSCSDECDTCYDSCTETAYDTCYDQCPVYDDWCNYNFYEWLHVDTEITSGSDHNVVWGSRFQTDGSVTQRILTTQVYEVGFVQNQDHWTYPANTLDNFNRFNTGDVWDVKTNLAGMIWPQHRM